MDSTLVTPPVTYNPNLLVTYKKIDPDRTVSYPVTKVVNLEYDLSRLRTLTVEQAVASDKIQKIIENLSEDKWYDSSVDKDEVLNELCEILDYNPVKTINFSGTVTFEGTIEIPIEDSDTFDLHSELEDNLTLDSYSGNVEINEYRLTNVYEE